MDSEGSAKTFNKFLVLKNFFSVEFCNLRISRYKQGKWHIILLSREQWADLATERERQLTTAHAIQTTGLTNGRAAN